MNYLHTDFVEFNNAERRESCGDSRTIVIAKGRFAGALSIYPFLDAKNSIDDSGLFAIHVDFMDDAGRAWRYSNVLSAMSLRPGAADAVSIVEGKRPPGWDVSFMAHMPDGFGWRFGVADGEIIEAPRGSNTFDVVLYAKPDGRVLANAQIGMCHPRAHRGVLRFEYALDISRLLWRHAPQISRGKVELEGKNFIDLTPLDVNLRSLTPSNVRILHNETTSGGACVGVSSICDRSLTTPILLKPQPVSLRDSQASLHKSVAMPIPDQRIVAYGEPPSIETSPGNVCGHLRLDRYTPPSDVEPDGWVSVVFDFLDENGRPWRYVGIVGAWLFWPPSNTTATVTPRRGPGDLMMSTLLDGRDDATLRLDTGESITVRLKYFSFDVAMTPGPDPARIRVHANMCPVNDHPLAPGSILCIEYDVPVAELLWRRATVVMDDEALVEGTDYIDVRSLESIDPSVPRSPIRVLKSNSEHGL